MKFLIILLLFVGCADKDTTQDSNLSKLIKSYDELTNTEDQFYFLENAIIESNLDMVKYAIDNGFPINYKGLHTLLSVSSRYGDIPIFDYLISKGANINLDYGEDFSSVLFFALFEDRSKFIKRNFDKYSNEITNIPAIKKGMLYWATSYGATNSMLYLMEDTPLYDDLLFGAVNSRDVNVLKLLYDNDLTNLNATSRFGYTLIDDINALSSINEAYEQDYQLMAEWVKSKSLP